MPADDLKLAQLVLCKSMDEPIKNLQEQIAYMQAELAQLSDELYAQQKEITSLRDDLQKTQQKLADVRADSGILNAADDVPPPHY